jgi:hypothetical protein
MDEKASVSKTLMSCLHFLRITDPHDGLISLSNIALIVAIAKIALSKTPPSLNDLAALFLAFGNYNAKKLLAPDLNGVKANEHPS